MQPRRVHLHYGFSPDGQQGADVHHPLFALLSALHEQGSIQQAARATGASYRHVWGALRQWEAVFGEKLVTWTQGQPARLTPFAERLLWAETRARARLTPHIEALRAALERALAEALDGSQQVLRLYASHDPALSLLRERASAEHRLHIDLQLAGSMDALRALADGRCLVAGLHMPLLADADTVYAQALKPLLQPGRHLLIGCARRTQGLMVAKSNPLRLRALEDLARRPVRFIHRQAGSATRLLTDHWLAERRIDSGLITKADHDAEDSPMAVAAVIASGLGDVGMGTEAAARAHGLDFVPLIEEDGFLVCRKEALDHPAVVQLCALLRRPEWRDGLSGLPGYQPQRSGEVLSLTRALPWWPVPTPRQPGDAEA